MTQFLTSDELRVELVNYKKGNRLATDKLINSYKHYVYRVARKQAEIWNEGYGHSMSALLDSDDLIQQGMIGLLRAFDRFDPNRGTPFLSYAGWFVLQAMQQWLKNSLVIRRKQNRLEARAIHPIEEVSLQYRNGAAGEQNKKKVLIDFLDNYLNQTERVIVCLNFGIGCEPMALDQIANQLGSTIARLRLRFGRIMKKLEYQASKL